MMYVISLVQRAKERIASNYALPDVNPIIQEQRKDQEPVLAGYHGKTHDILFNAVNIVEEEGFVLHIGAVSQGSFFGTHVLAHFPDGTWKKILWEESI